MNHADLIEAKGGAAEMARLMGVKPGIVRMWKYRGRIARTAWLDVMDAFPDVTLEMLRLGERPTKRELAA